MNESRTKSRMSCHVIWMNESCHIHECVSWMNESQISCPVPVAYTSIGRVTHVNGSCHAYEWVTNESCSARSAHINESCHTYISHIEAVESRTKSRMSRHVIWMNESCHTYIPHKKAVESHMSACHVTHMNRSRTSRPVPVAHTSMSHACVSHIYLTREISGVTHVKMSCHTYEWVTNESCSACSTDLNESCHTLHVIRMNESCRIHEWVSYMNESRTSRPVPVEHISLSHVTHVCHMNDWVMSNTGMSLLYGWVTNEVTNKSSCPIHEWMNEWVMSNTWMSLAYEQVTNGSSRACSTYTQTYNRKTNTKRFESNACLYSNTSVSMFIYVYSYV